MTAIRSSVHEVMPRQLPDVHAVRQASRTQALRPGWCAAFVKGGEQRFLRSQESKQNFDSKKIFF
jgi:hypothetical protein